MSACVQERKQFLEIGVGRMGRLQGQRLKQAFRTQLAACAGGLCMASCAACGLGNEGCGSTAFAEVSFFGMDQEPLFCLSPPHILPPTF